MNPTTMKALSIQTDYDFKRCISQGVALVGFNTAWCAPCRLQEPIMNGLAGKMSGQAIVANLNIDRNPQPAVRLDIFTIPTLVIFRDGREFNRLVGLQSEKTLIEAISNALPRKGN